MLALFFAFLVLVIQERLGTDFSLVLCDFVDLYFTSSFLNRTVSVLVIDLLVLVFVLLMPWSFLGFSLLSLTLLSKGKFWLRFVSFWTFYALSS